ncbi:Abnormal spindle-like microcephaly-assoc'd, ASPM-SPD-2-Hydin, partial [Granulicella rosea]
ARAYVYTNLALQFLDKRYGTALAVSNATVLAYCQLAAGLTVDPYGGYWFSLKGLGLEVNGTGNGSFDGGYGLNDEHLNIALAKILADNGLETSTSHPIRDIAVSGVASFSNFLQPGLLATGSTFTATQRIDEDITFRKNLNVGEVEPGGDYYAAGSFADPYALHGMYREKALGITWTLPAFGSGHFDDTLSDYLHEFLNYSALCAKVNSTSDSTGVSFLQEATHPDGVFVDPTGSSLAVKYKGETLDMVLNFRPLQAPGASGVKPSAANEVVDNLARVHDTTATIDRVATFAMPATTATGASGGYTSGAFGTLYIGRYGNYLAGLNWQSNAVSMTLPPDMTTGTATDVATGVNYDLTQTSVISVPAQSGVVLYQSLPTATLSSTTVNLGAVAPGSSATRVVTLSNTGSGPLLIGALSLAGSNTNDYAYTSTCGSSLAVGAPCTISFTFTPSASGTRTASFSLLTCVSKTAQIVSLTGGSNLPTLTIAPASFSRFFDTPNPTLTYTLSGFVGSDTQANSTTGAPSLATLAVRTSPAGSYTISASAGTLQSSKYFLQFATGTLTVTGGAPQRITFAPLAPLSNGSTLRLSASTSSGLPVAFNVVSGPATISGTLLTTNGTGAVVVNAAQAGDATYAAAVSTTRSLSVQ